MPTWPLDTTAIEAVLRRAPLVRVAFRSDAPYVLAFGFTFHDGCLVGMTGQGTKVELAKRDPRVGFQVDTSLEDGIYAWESVHGHGTIRFSPPEREILEAIESSHGTPPDWFTGDRMQDFRDGTALTYRIEPTELHGIRCGPSQDD